MNQVVVNDFSCLLQGFPLSYILQLNCQVPNKALKVVKPLVLSFHTHASHKHLLIQNHST